MRPFLRRPCCKAIRRFFLTSPELLFIHENWQDWGRDIPTDHKYAVVVAEEMSLDMIGSTPHTPSVMESMKNYAKGAYIPTQLAAFIANLGYEATANHLRHYTAILPPLAVNAGLGEVGRLGYLMTKEFGPRIRLSAVTTNRFSLIKIAIFYYYLLLLGGGEGFYYLF